jgi:hypothetical protein
MVNGELTYYESPTRTLDNTGSGVSVQQLRGIVCLVRECVSSIISFKARVLSSYTSRIAAFYDRPVQTGGVNDWRPIFLLYFKIMAGVGWELFTLSQSVFFPFIQLHDLLPLMSISALRIEYPLPLDYDRKFSVLFGRLANHDCGPNSDEK